MDTNTKAYIVVADETGFKTEWFPTTIWRGVLREAFPHYSDKTIAAFITHIRKTGVLNGDLEVNGLMARWLGR